ncbi:SIS domain-containing protein [Pelagibacterium xiamenense]|uniref:SIS domain-containing protein n=1 Tax=Pelagibacterium xiamenense TaxID=2901140 RepID=UPI001E3853C2|nr:SIS domain-containing protein [Pelagibacterium xiamenense]MCD7058784.1 SIS domain-containing protein [Pelagibacterium xiamenense]
MGQLRFIYRDRIVGLIDDVLSSQAAALDAAVKAVADTLARDGLIHVAGSGHSHMLAEEVFYRAGGIAAAQAILDPELMLHQGAERSTLLEREEGRAARVLPSYNLSQGDVLFIASNSGRNAYPIEMALAARDRGLTTVAITSISHSTKSQSRHSSGQLLYEVCDIAIDNGGDYGDAGLDIPGRNARMGPTSTIAGVYILNAILAEAVALLAQQGITPDIYQSANAEDLAGGMLSILERWRHRIQHL